MSEIHTSKSRNQINQKWTAFHKVITLEGQYVSPVQDARSCNVLTRYCAHAFQQRNEIFRQLNVKTSTLVQTVHGLFKLVKI